MIEIKKPEISERFDMNDIRKIRDYNSQRHLQMTPTEIVEDIRSGAEEVIQKYGLKIQRIYFITKFPIVQLPKHKNFVEQPKNIWSS